MAVPVLVPSDQSLLLVQGPMLVTCGVSSERRVEAWPGPRAVQVAELQSLTARAQASQQHGLLPECSRNVSQAPRAGLILP